MKKIISFFAFCLIYFSNGIAQDTTQKIDHSRKNNKSQYSKPYVILISADGFRADYTDLYPTPFLNEISKKGVKAEYMMPSFPSLTFPNHYTIVTGLYPSHHGLVNNNYYDVGSNQHYNMGNKKMVAEGKWYGGTPLWVLAEKQKMLAASFYWVASEADIQNTRPSYYYNYNEKIDIGTRIQKVKEWLSLPEEKRPHLITFYFPEVDHEGHYYGPNDIHVENSVKFVDSSIQALQASLASLHLPINYVFVSDHGMTRVDNINTLSMPAAIDTTAFTIPWGDALVHLYAKDASKIEPAYQALKKDTSFTVYKLDETPSYWHYKKSDDRYNRLGDLLLVPHLPKVFNFSTRKTTPGKHGFDNHTKDMRATFIAWGPAFKKGIKIKGFENVNIYPLIAHILGLKIDEKRIDGKLKVLKPILKK